MKHTVAALQVDWSSPRQEGFLYLRCMLGLICFLAEACRGLASPSLASPLLFQNVLS